ncbi:MAG: hypothetical protein ACI4FX_08230 [Agathobacter sp.]
MLIYVGVAVMIAALLLLGITVVCYLLRNKNIRKQMDEEYGDPQHYNIQKKGT